MSSPMFDTNNLDNDYLPPEIIWKIFEYLDYRSLVFCMAVNTRWKNIAEDYIETHNLWEAIVRAQMVNKGITFQRKSNLDWKYILINSVLWSSFMQLACVEHHHTYRLKDISKLHMYKGKLIVLTKANLKYFDIMNFKMIRIYKRSSKVIDFTENENMIVVYWQEQKHGCEINLHGKVTSEDFCFDTNITVFMDRVLLYKLEDNVCYVVTTRYVVWACIWNKHSWDIELVGRYYGNKCDGIYALHVFNDRVYMVTKYGLVLYEHTGTKSFRKAFSYTVPSYKSPSNWVMFHRHDAAVAIRRSERRFTVHYEKANDNVTLECADMTCATEHGEVMFFGFKDGTVVICRTSNLLYNRGVLERYLHVRDYEKSITDPSVLALDVYEDKQCHHLFIATKHHVIQLFITYPSSITNEYN